MSQTIRAHRLSRKAFELGGQEMQEKYMDAIFHAYFTEGKNVGDYEILGELAEQAGIMSKEKVRRLEIMSLKGMMTYPRSSTDRRVPRLRRVPG